VRGDTGGDGHTPYWMIAYEVPEETSPDQHRCHYSIKEAIEYRASEHGPTDLDTAEPAARDSPV
jgi:hypothetical protein